jgi:chemotaxis protein CheD
MGIVTVDMSDLKVSRNPNEELITYALGSCIALMLHDPKRRMGGMIHYMLPNADNSPDLANKEPAMFADLGVPLLFDNLIQRGSQPSDLVAKVAGGGSFIASSTLNIGRRNYLAVCEQLKKRNIPITAEDVGGAKSRTARLHVGSGAVSIKSQNGIQPL